MGDAGMSRRTPSYGSDAAEADRFRLLVEAVTDYAIYMLDPSGVVTSWNPGARHIKGYDASEIVGRNFANFYEEADRKAGVPQRALATAARVAPDPASHLLWAEIVRPPTLSRCLGRTSASGPSLPQIGIPARRILRRSMRSQAYVVLQHGMRRRTLNVRIALPNPFYIGCLPAYD